VTPLKKKELEVLGQNKSKALIQFLLPMGQKKLSSVGGVGRFLVVE